ncbi:MAG: hypothetical protein IPM85_05245 [Chitinophagaceae bacterium]|nr:hypothetical protein [Chitinophagaceae bacterium]
MENSEETNTGSAEAGKPENSFSYPPKYEKPDDRGNILIKSVASLAIYLLAGYFFFPSYKILLLVTLVVLIHEMGHFLAMKFYGYNDLGVFLSPVSAYVSGNKREVSPKQSAVIILAGRCPELLSASFYCLLEEANRMLNWRAFSIHKPDCCLCCST